MNRKALEELKDWKNSPDRKPLVLKGARQVGKTWLMKEFGKTCYSKYFYFNFDDNEELSSVFLKNKDAVRLIELLGMISGEKILPEKHLIIFDEIQECPEALNSLKYFCENACEYHVIAAGSLLGTLLAQPKSYPVGKVNLMTVTPMTFEEFLEAFDEGMYRYYSSVRKGTDVESLFHSRLTEAYRYYLIIGGMPECVSSWIKYRDPNRVDRIQKELIELYESDFSKHNGKINSGRILMVFRSIVTQLAKDNEKFIYGCIREGARAREFEEAIEWLVSAGMIVRVYNISKPEHPVKAYQQLNHFKLFVFDTGLLKQMAGVSNESIILNTDFQFKGPLTENYILEQIRGVFDSEPVYFAPDSSNEIDFIVQDGNAVIPVEVKSGESIKSNSFKKYIREYSPDRAVRFSSLGLEYGERIVNIPHYFAGKIKELI